MAGAAREERAFAHLTALHLRLFPIAASVSHRRSVIASAAKQSRLSPRKDSGLPAALAMTTRMPREITPTF